MYAIALAILILAAVEAVATYIIGGRMADAVTALADLTKFVDDLTSAVQSATDEFGALLTEIKNNNGVNPGAIETLITKGEAMVASLKDSVAAAQASVAPPQQETPQIEAPSEPVPVPVSPAPSSEPEAPQSPASPEPAATPVPEPTQEAPTVEDANTVTQ